MRWRLVFRGREVDLPPGEFLIGRGVACNLQVDDALVSRRHALLRTSPVGVGLEDAGSRNGVFVNGKLISAPVMVTNGDVVKIGNAEMTILGVPARRDDTVREDQPRHKVEVRETVEGPLLDDFDKVPTSPSAVLLDLVEKSLTQGKTEDAVWILRKVAGDIDRRRATGAGVSLETMEQTARYAVQVACSVPEPRWLTWIFDSYRGLGAVLPATLLDELHPAIRQLRPEPAPLSRYVQAMRERAAKLSAGDRFLLQRLEGLLAVANSG